MPVLLHRTGQWRCMPPNYPLSPCNARHVLSRAHVSPRLSHYARWKTEASIAAIKGKTPEPVGPQVSTVVCSFLRGFEGKGGEGGAIGVANSLHYLRRVGSAHLVGCCSVIDPIECSSVPLKYHAVDRETIPGIHYVKNWQRFVQDSRAKHMSYSRSSR